MLCVWVLVTLRTAECLSLWLRSMLNSSPRKERKTTRDFFLKKRSSSLLYSSKRLIWVPSPCLGLSFYLCTMSFVLSLLSLVLKALSPVPHLPSVSRI